MRALSTMVMIVLLAASSGCGRFPDGEMGPVTQPFGDDQVVGLAVVLCDHQVQVGSAALSRGLLSIPSVQAYAMRIVAEQTVARDRLIALAAAQGLTIDESTTEAKAHLTDTSVDIGNRQRDPAYLADSVHDVGKAIRVWQNTLLVEVRNPALQAELEVTLQTFNAELAAGQGLLVETGIPPK